MRSTHPEADPEPEPVQAIRAAASLGTFDWEPGSVSERLMNVERVGAGETYEAWRLDLAGSDPVVLRVVHRPVDTMPRPMQHEFAALQHVPADVGPRGLAMDDTCDNPLGRPWMLATFTPGSEKPVAAWTDDDLARTAQQLARLHEPPVAVRGPVDSPARVPLDIEAEFATGCRWWHDHHPEITTQPRFRTLRPRVAAFLQRHAGEFRRLDTFALIHSDLVATNVVVDGTGTPRFIDWEWGEYDDVAKDLALLGGTVHGGPWYVPMTSEQVERFVAAYASARGALTGIRPDETALLRRRDAWEVHERFQAAMHNAMRAADPATPDRAMYAQAVEAVLATLAARVDTAADTSTGPGTGAGTGSA